jgi:hypothetical protein
VDLELFFEDGLGLPFLGKPQLNFGWRLLREQGLDVEDEAEFPELQRRVLLQIVGLNIFNIVGLAHLGLIYFMQQLPFHISRT